MGCTSSKPAGQIEEHIDAPAAAAPAAEESSEKVVTVVVETVVLEESAKKEEAAPAPAAAEEPKAAEPAAAAEEPAAAAAPAATEEAAPAPAPTAAQAVAEVKAAAKRFEEFQKFLPHNASVLLASTLSKLSNSSLVGYQERYLILTDKPSLEYVDAAKKTHKGVIEWDPKNPPVASKVDNEMHVTVESRVYKFKESSDKSVSLDEWVRHINSTASKHKA